MSTTSSEESIADEFTTGEEDDLSYQSASDVDLEELYESFDYDDDIQGTLSDHVPKRSINVAPLYQGSQLTVFQSHLLTFQYALRHSLSAKAFTELLKLLSVHAPKGAFIPTSIHNMKHCFLEAFSNTSPVHHAYCSFCQRPLESVDAHCTGHGCRGGWSAVFITLPIGEQIKRLMEGMNAQQLCMCK